MNKLDDQDLFFLMPSMYGRDIFTFLLGAREMKQRSLPRITWKREKSGVFLKQRVNKYIRTQNSCKRIL